MENAKCTYNAESIVKALHFMAAYMNHYNKLVWCKELSFKQL